MVAASTVDKAVASGTQVHAIGTVKTVVGLVKAIDENGVQRLLQAGDLVYPNETIITADNSGIIVQFDNGSFLDLPPSANIVLNDEVYEPPAQAAADEAARIQRAIEAGIDPSVAAQAAATGGERDEGAYVPLVIDFNNSLGSGVTSGFPTAPVVEPLPPVPPPETGLPIENAAAVALGLLPPAVNTPPTDAGETISTGENTVVAGNVLSNASDADGDTLRVTQFTLAGSAVTHAAGETVVIPGIGSLLINSDGAFTFTPVTNFVGSVPAATYVVSDGHGGTTSSMLDITVTQTVAASLLAVGADALAPASTSNLANGSSENIGSVTHNGSTVGNGTVFDSGGASALDGHSSTLLQGSGANDILVGSSNNDTLIGGAGNDTLTGGGGRDTFVWGKGESGVDTITDFSKGSSGDVLKLTDLLEGATSSNLAEGGYLKFSYDENSGSTRITIDSNGSASGGSTQVIVLEHVDLTAHNTLSTSAIIHNLLHDGNLKVDT